MSGICCIWLLQCIQCVMRYAAEAVGFVPNPRLAQHLVLPSHCYAQLV